ncbi:hypothetical protein H4R34_002348 [Dimargaris verticillata]|uniref:Transmembrane protein n=1 Tax=Dimargaris verticillata TaxID=2761393 RepID=A0A9W8B2R0_9FUNG|nr:hypothetical protein H4R34_002348 [Dimargaris verticillata]
MSNIAVSITLDEDGLIVIPESQFMWWEAQAIILPMIALAFLAMVYNALCLLRCTYQARKALAQHKTTSLTPSPAFTKSQEATATHSHFGPQSTMEYDQSLAYASYASADFAPAARGLGTALSYHSQMLNGNSSTAASSSSNLDPESVIVIVGQSLLLVIAVIGCVTMALQTYNVALGQGLCDLGCNLGVGAYYVCTALLTVCVGILGSISAQWRAEVVYASSVAVLATAAKIFLLVRALQGLQVTSTPACSFGLAWQTILITSALDAGVWLIQAPMLRPRPLPSRHDATSTGWWHQLSQSHVACGVAACGVGVVGSLGTIAQGLAGFPFIFPCWYITWVVCFKLTLESFAQRTKWRYRDLLFAHESTNGTTTTADLPSKLTSQASPSHHGEPTSLSHHGTVLATSRGMALSEPRGSRRLHPVSLTGTDLRPTSHYSHAEKFYDQEAFEIEELARASGDQPSLPSHYLP